MPKTAAGGSGLTPANYHELIAAGVDCITLGDHIYRRREIMPRARVAAEHRQAGQLSADGAGPRVCRRRAPATASTWPCSACWAGSSCGRSIAPGPRPTACWPRLPPDVKVILVDFHAEATSDKQLMGRYLDGRVSAVLGTHTHVPTADESILPGGTAFQCDVGMTGRSTASSAAASIACWKRR